MKKNFNFLLLFGFILIFVGFDSYAQVDEQDVEACLKTFLSSTSLVEGQIGTFYTRKYQFADYEHEIGKSVTVDNLIRKYDPIIMQKGGHVWSGQVNCPGTDYKPGMSIAVYVYYPYTEESVLSQAAAQRGFLKVRLIATGNEFIVFTATAKMNI